MSTIRADLVLEPESTIEESLLAALRPKSAAAFVGYGHRVAMCEVLDNGYMVENGQKELPRPGSIDQRFLWVGSR